MHHRDTEVTENKYAYSVLSVSPYELYCRAAKRRSTSSQSSCMAVSTC